MTQYKCAFLTCSKLMVDNVLLVYNQRLLVYMHMCVCVTKRARRGIGANVSGVNTCENLFFNS